MQIKKRHVQMARAAWRSPKMWLSLWWSDPPLLPTIDRWHRAAKGKHQ